MRNIIQEKRKKEKEKKKKKRKKEKEEKRIEGLWRGPPCCLMCSLFWLHQYTSSHESCRPCWGVFWSITFFITIWPREVSLPPFLPSLSLFIFIFIRIYLSWIFYFFISLFSYYWPFFIFFIYFFPFLSISFFLNFFISLFNFFKS